MAEVSIIVPVYQVENYIRQCVDSILEQTFTDFELILVDDGSKDRSGQICDEYARIDERVKVIHQDNCGVATARNHAIDSASGNYLCFVDADDWIENTMVEKCIAKIEKYDADVLRHGHVMELWNADKCVGQEKKNVPDFVEEFPHNQIAKNMEKFWENCSNYVWNYFFRKEAIGSLRFPDIKISEDHIFVLNVLEQCEKICILSDSVYHYCMRMGSCANRWQEEGIECQMKMIQACHHFMNCFEMESERKRKLLSNMILSAYAYTIYLLCFPECKWSIKEKMAKLREVREKLKVDLYVPYAQASGLSCGDKIKQKLIAHGQEKLLIIFGPIFMRVVRKAGG